MKILGISAYYHDSAVALIGDEGVLFAAQEERYTRIKYDLSFPHMALAALIEKFELKLEDLDAIVFYDKPFLKFERIVESYLHHAPKGLASFRVGMPIWLNQKLFFKQNIRRSLAKAFGSKYANYKLLFCDHHLSHSAFAFFTSGFDKSTLISVDGVGEWATTAIKIGDNSGITSLREQSYPNSLGLFYSAVTYFLGFAVNSGEYKVMGLAPYANPSSVSFSRMKRLITGNIVKIFEDGSIYLNPDYFAYSTSLKMIHVRRWEKLLGVRMRNANDPISEDHCHLALAAQDIVEQTILKLARFAKELTKTDSICFSGGVALNCVANGKLLEAEIFDNIHIPFSPGDSGSAIGAGLAVKHLYFKEPRKLVEERQVAPFLGVEFTDTEIARQLDQSNLRYVRLPDEELFDFTAREISTGKVVGWFQGRAEFGPRALGNRSILADPRDPAMQSKINIKVKGRESFRPFAPAVLDNFVKTVYKGAVSSGHMSFVFFLKDDWRLNSSEVEGEGTIEQKLRIQRSIFPAVTHVDFSSRVQTVTKSRNEKLWNLISAFHKMTECPMLLNTSFNGNEEPIVNSPSEAIDCFLRTNLDILVMNNYIVIRED